MRPGLLFSPYRKWRLRKESQVCKSSQLLSNRPGFKSTQADPGPCFLLSTPTKLLTPPPHAIASHCLSSGVRHDRDKCSISVACDRFFSTLRFFFDKPDLFPQPGYWFCNYRDEVSCHLSVWPLPKTCFQFLERLDLLPFLFGMS